MTPEAKARLLARLTRDALRAEKISERAKARPDPMVESLAPAAGHVTRAFPDTPAWRQKLESADRAVSYSHAVCDWVSADPLLTPAEYQLQLERARAKRLAQQQRRVLTFPKNRYPSSVQIQSSGPVPPPKIPVKPVIEHDAEGWWVVADDIRGPFPTRSAAQAAP